MNVVFLGGGALRLTPVFKRTFKMWRNLRRWCNSLFCS